MPDNLILMGRIGRAHGVRGQVRIATYTVDPLTIADYGPLSDEAGNVYEISETRPAKNGVIATMETVVNREAAEKLNGTNLYVSRDRLPADLDEGTYYHADLVGLEAFDATDAALGRVVAVHDFGAGDILEIEPATGGQGVLVPFTRAAVPVVDIPQGRLVIADIEGFRNQSQSDAE